MILRLTGSFLLCFASAIGEPGPAPAFFAMDTGMRGAANRTTEARAKLTKELGFAGIGSTYSTPEALKKMIEAEQIHHMKLFAVYLGVDLDAPQPISRQIRDSIQQLSGSDTILWLYLRKKSVEPSNPAADEQAVRVLREIATLADADNLKIALYPHHGFWLATTGDAVRLAKAASRNNLGVTFNLCHWLKTGDADLETEIGKALPYLLLVTINGAEADGKKWNELIQPLGRGSYDVRQLLVLLKEGGFHGAIGLQHYGIKGDDRSNLEASMSTWREMATAVWGG